VRVAGVVVGLMAFGWALVAAADSRQEPVQGMTWTETFVQTVAAGPDLVETPHADSLVDWDEVDRQTDCLWLLLQDAGVELTLEVVLAAGVWTDALGGACLVIGEDDE
jgi:hypothetical protein